MATSAQLLLSSAALAASGYLFYKVLRLYGGEDNRTAARETVSAIGNYYADDQLTNDVESELSPLDKKRKTVKKMDVNLFNVSTGNGSWIRMDEKGLESLIRDNNRSLDIIFI